jgi:hypothetical protein
VFGLSPFGGAKMEELLVVVVPEVSQSSAVLLLGIAAMEDCCS